MIHATAPGVPSLLGRRIGDELRRSLHIVRRRGRSITIAVLLSIVPGLFWKLVLRL